jgi:hypothetical protein
MADTTTPTIPTDDLARRSAVGHKGIHASWPGAGVPGVRRTPVEG